MECKVVVYRDDCRIEKSGKSCEGKVMQVMQVNYTYPGSKTLHMCTPSKLLTR